MEQPLRVRDGGKFRKFSQKTESRKSSLSENRNQKQKLQRAKNYEIIAFTMEICRTEFELEDDHYYLESAQFLVFSFL